MKLIERAPIIVAFSLLALIAATPAEAVKLTRQPYLQLMTTTSVTVVWGTDVVAPCSLALRPVGGATKIVSGATSAVCAIALTGLMPGTEYGYVPRAGGTPLFGESVFHTDDPNAPYSFLVLGDSGTGGAMQLAVRDRMLATPADFILHSGDMVYDDGAAKDFDPKFFRPYQDLLRKMVLWPSLGNHDTHTSSGAPWRAAFWTPANNPANSENYYSFDYGNAHVAVLNSNGNLDPGDPQHLFLDSDLAASNAVWKFVVFHHTIYSSGEHGSSVGIRNSLVPLFDRYGVDIVFMGHDHDYERTVPLLADLEVAPGSGTVYVTTGGGGQNVRAIGSNTWTADVENVFHYVRVAIDGGGLTLHMIREDGTIGDAMTLAKGATPPPPRCGDGIVDPGAEQCDGGDRFACKGPCTATCTCAPICGDGVRNQAFEACDLQDDAACPDRCLSNCRCGEAGRFVTLEPVADTYIQDGAQASWDHGAAPELDVDVSPLTTSFLKFDLDSLGAPVSRATLVLSCTNTSPDGGVVYPVGDSSWVEGTGTGTDPTSEGGFGLKWTDVDTNGNGNFDDGDTSPWLPDMSQMVSGMSCIKGQATSLDVTHTLTALTGLNTVAIKNGSSDGASYASREELTASRHPQLRLELTMVPVTTTTTTLKPTTSTSTTSSTSSTSTTTSSSTTSSTSSTSSTSTTLEPTTSTTTSTSTSSSTLPPTTTTRPPTTTTQAPTTTSTSTTTSSTTTSTSTTVTTTTTVQIPTTTMPPIPRATVQADVSAKEDLPATNFGTEPLVETDASPGTRLFVRIRVTGVAGRPLGSVRLRLRVAQVAGAPSDTGGRIRRISACFWHELTVTWQNQPALDGGVLDTAPAVAAGDFVDFELMPAVQGDGVYCFAIDTDSADGVIYTARESSEDRPAVFLELATSPTTTTTTTSTTSTSTIPKTTTSTIATTTSTIATTTSTIATTTSTVPVTTTTLPPPTTTILGDVTVREAEPDTNLGGTGLLEADNSPRERSFIRVQVSGLAGRSVTSAILRLTVAQPKGSASDSGGRIQRIADCTWSEFAVTWNTMPDMPGPVLDAIGAVDYGEVVEFDVTSTIGVNGVYCFALDTTSANAVMYTSRETATPPALLVQTAP